MGIEKINNRNKNYSSLIIGIIAGVILTTIPYLIDNFIRGYVFLILFILLPIFGLIIKERLTPLDTLKQRIKTGLIITGTMTICFILKGLFTWSNEENDIFYVSLLTIGFSVFLS